MASRGPKIPGARFSEKKKKNVLFLNFIGPVTLPWVLYPSEIRRVGSPELALARAMFERSIKVIGWQSGAPKPREHDFPEKKKPHNLLKYTVPATPLWVLYPSDSEIMHIGSKELLIARAVFARSVSVLGWQPGAPKSREHDFQKKKLIFLNFIGPVTPPWLLYPSEIMHMGSTRSLLARAVIARSIKKLGFQPGAPKTREQDFPKKTSCLFELLRTSDTSMGSVALCNHAFGFLGTFTSHCGVCKVN